MMSTTESVGRTESSELFTERPEEYGPPEIEPGEIEYHEETDFLGEGVFGRVYKGSCRSCQVAVKVPRNQTLSPEELLAFRREVNIMSQIYHPNVVLFMGACTQPGKIQIVTERMSTDLDKFLRSPKGRAMPLFVRLKMAKDAARGMAWLHGISNIVHRDLKPANLLIDANLNIKVTDFGFSQTLKGDAVTRDQTGPRGSALYMAPELIQRKEFDKTADVYSFGMILWELVTLHVLFPEYSKWDEFAKAVIMRNERPPIPPELPHSLKSLFMDCWDVDRTRRPLFPAIVTRLNHVLVDVAVDVPSAALFWSKYFLHQRHELEEVVSWEDLVAALVQETQIRDTTRFAVLQPYLAIFGSDHKVTMHAFNRTVNWFGLFFAADRAQAVLDEAEETCRADWFHGGIEKNEAEARLQGEAEGVFLVRLSRTVADCPFTMSIAPARHIRITREEHDGTSAYALVAQRESPAKARFATLPALIEGVKRDLKLTVPCPKHTAPVGSYL